MPRLRSALVVAEVAVSLVLLTAAGLLLRSFDKMRSVDLGLPHRSHLHRLLWACPNSNTRPRSP